MYDLGPHRTPSLRKVDQSEILYVSQSIGQYSIKSTVYISGEGKWGTKLFCFINSVPLWGLIFRGNTKTFINISCFISPIRKKETRLPRSKFPECFVNQNRHGGKGDAGKVH